MLASAQSIYASLANSARVISCFSMILIGCASPGDDDNACPEGTVRSGLRCVADPSETSIRSNAGGQSDSGQTNEDPATAPLSLPVAIDDWYAPSGYMGDAAVGGLDAGSCPRRAEGAVGECHRFLYTPLDADGGGEGWAGVYWQYPENNWGLDEDNDGQADTAGLKLPPGIRSVLVTAWGKSGGEVVSLAAGLGGLDGFKVDIADIALTTEPTEYLIDLRGVSYNKVIGAFAWTASAADSAMTIYMDNLMFSDREGEGPPPAIKPSGTPGSLPVSVDDYWSPSGYMGDGEVGGIQTFTCPQRPESAVGVCHGFNWMPVDDGPGWAGVYWQYPENNWGEPDENGERLPGLTMPAGAQSIRFSAWGETGTEVVSFAAGLANIDGFSVERADIALTDEPTEYVIDLRNAEYTTIVGAFSWSASSVGGSRFHIDDIHYSAEPPEGDAPPPDTRRSTRGVTCRRR